MKSGSFRRYVLALKENPYLGKAFYNVCDLEHWKFGHTGHGFSWVVWINSTQDENDILRCPNFLGMENRLMRWWIGKAHRLGLGAQCIKSDSLPAQEIPRARARSNWK